jgi:hypothetical protein
MKKLIRFSALQERGIVGNRMTLSRWIEHENFPPGVLLGPNTRVWVEDEVEAWLASRPVALERDSSVRAKRDCTGETENPTPTPTTDPTTTVSWSGSRPSPVVRPDEPTGGAP